MQQLDKLTAHLKRRGIKKPKVVVLTGAGISAESGLKTFRDNDGLWENHRVEDVATPEAFSRNPELVYRFYNLRRASLSSVSANAAHLALADAEYRLGDNFLLITQNVDNLHQRAGSNRLLHMHGELNKARCNYCDTVCKWLQPLDQHDTCAACNQRGALRPHIVWFGEMPLYMETIEAALLRCDVFVSIGTSGNVYPAAGFFDIANRAGALTVELNMEPSANAAAFDIAMYGPATETVPQFFNAL